VHEQGLAYLVVGGAQIQSSMKVHAQVPLQVNQGMQIQVKHHVQTGGQVVRTQMWVQMLMQGLWVQVLVSVLVVLVLVPGLKALRTF